MKPRTLTDHALAWYRRRHPSVSLRQIDRAEAVKQFTQYINQVIKSS